MPTKNSLEVNLAEPEAVAMATIQLISQCCVARQKNLNYFRLSKRSLRTMRGSEEIPLRTEWFQDWQDNMTLRGYATFEIGDHIGITTYQTINSGWTKIKPDPEED